MPRLLNVLAIAYHAVTNDIVIVPEYVYHFVRYLH